MEENVTKPKFPTEIVDLPSKGLIYPKDNPLSSGQIEMKYMTAREEDILTNQNYISKGIVLDKLIESLIVSKVNINDIIIGDKNALLIASRILGYGKDYTFRAYNSDTQGQFHMDFPGLENQIIFGMGGYGGNMILIDVENSRILVVNSLHYNNKKYKYNHKKLLHDPFKK